MGFVRVENSFVIQNGDRPSLKRMYSFTKKRLKILKRCGTRSCGTLKYPHCVRSVGHEVPGLEVWLKVPIHRREPEGSLYLYLGLYHRHVSNRN